MNIFEQNDAQELIKNLGGLNSQFAGKTVLLLGCGGFLGSALTNYFLQLNQTELKYAPVKVIASDCYVIGNTPKIYEDENFKAVNHDICYPFNLKIGPDDKIDYILNMTSVASPMFYKKLPMLTFNVGSVGTQNVLDLAYQKQVKSVVCMSSSEVYGNPDEANIPTKEEYNGNLSNIGERACYDTSKRALETICDIYHRLYKVPVKVVRPFNCFGIPMGLNDGRVLPAFLKKAMNGEKITVYGEGKETRTFIYVTSFLEGLIKILLSKENGEIFNLGNPEGEISMKDLAFLVQKITNCPEVQMAEPPPVYKIQPQRRAASIEKLQKVIDFKPSVSLEEGITRYYNWALESSKKP